MYESPISIEITRLHSQIQEAYDNYIFREVSNVVVDVDKDELIRALRYDRDQYDKGYRDAMESLMSNGVRVMKWIPASEPPKEYGEYIVQIRYGATATTLYYDPEGDEWFEPDGFSHYDVTRWMPMPELPKEGEV